MENDTAIDMIRTAYQNKRLTLYLGAGVSVGNGLPTWDQLVLAMYYSALRTPDLGKGLRPYPNYLFAIAEWHLKRRQEPLDISARKIRFQFDSPNDFLMELKQTLYAGFALPESDVLQTPNTWSLLNTNPTLHAATELCKTQENGGTLHAVITYNYDSLLELALQNTNIQFTSIWRGNISTPPEDTLPIYHVHGYVPIEGDGSTPEELVFTEEQYHLVSQDAYSWSNLVQIHCMSSSTGLMIGLSLSDRNMRRLLDAIRKTPLQSQNFALLEKPRGADVQTNDVETINAKAQEYFELFERSGIKTDSRVFDEVKKIIAQVEEFDQQTNEAILRELGVEPIWYDNHQEIPNIVSSIVQT